MFLAIMPWGSLTTILTLYPKAILLLALVSLVTSISISSRATRSFMFSPKSGGKQQLILIAGCTGTGKSTFGMSVALSQSILKCVSTDTVREITRSMTPAPQPAELMRSSYQGDGEPVADWKASCHVLDSGINALVKDAMTRGTSLVLEGVHIQPDNVLLDEWRARGGIALGCLLMITDAEAHKSLIFKRGEITKKGEEKKINAFSRIRAIQHEMFKMAVAHDWLLIEQKIEPDPLDIVTSMLDASRVDN